MRTGTGALVLVATAVVLLWWRAPAAPVDGAGGGDQSGKMAPSSVPAPQDAIQQPANGGASSTTGQPPDSATPKPTKPSGDARDVEPPNATGQPVARPPAKILVLGSVFFPSGATALGPDASRMLQGIAATYKGTAQKLEIVGHADGRGDAETNVRLSTRRAEAVRSYLVARGVPSRNMSVKSEGDRTPMAQGVEPEANAQNRRVEVRVP